MGMKFSFVKKLDAVRDIAGIRLDVDSGFRTPQRNAAVGGEPGSAHLTGEAADIRAISSRTRFLVLNAAYCVGFKRIGIGDTFIHLDDSTSLVQKVVWLYPAGVTKRI
jgi:hypothetical protein